jgi:hypothetical protein
MSDDRVRRSVGRRRLWPVLLAGFPILVGIGIGIGWRGVRRGEIAQPVPAETGAVADFPRRSRAAVPRLLAPSARPAGGLAGQLADIRDRLGPSPTAEEVMALLNEIARSNPALAIDLADALGQTQEERALWVTDIAAQWTARQPQQAWDWLSRLDRGRILDLADGTLPETIIGKMAEGDPRFLVQNLDRLVHAGEGAGGVAPVVAVHAAMEALAENNRPDLARQAVETWARDPSKPAIGEPAYVTTAVAMSQTAPEGAAEWIKSMPASEERNTALVEYPAHWSKKQPRQAIQWAEKNLPADLKMRGLLRTFGEWVGSNPVEAGEWLASYLARVPANADTDQLVVLMINDPETRSRPAIGLRWVGLISDPETRHLHEEKVALRWARQDLAAAIDYIWKSPTISADRKQALLSAMSSVAYLESDD